MRTRQHRNNSKDKCIIASKIISHLDSSVNNNNQNHANLSLNPDLTIYSQSTIDFSNNITNLLNRTNTMYPDSCCFVSPQKSTINDPTHSLDELIHRFIYDSTFLNLNSNSNAPLNVDPNYATDIITLMMNTNDVKKNKELMIIRHLIHILLHLFKRRLMSILNHLMI